MTPEQKVLTFSKELAYINNTLVRSICSTALSDTPDYFFEVPASSTGKYHPDYALGKGGLVRHTKAAMLFASVLRTINPLLLSDYQLDITIAALILHDTRKLGMTDESKNDYTRFDHPLLAAKAIREMYNFEEEFMLVDDFAREIHNIANYIAKCIEPHMGQWNTSKYFPAISLPVPVQPIEHFVHMCDYLASRKEFDVKNLM
ncbi:MAG: hypothetical protein RR372_06565 [Oscillospiraceae bacterium]